MLIAGIGSDVSSWAGVAGELSKNFRVITFDNRGAGRSETPSGRYTVRQMAADAVRVLDHLKIKKANVLGHSLGGYIAEELAIRHPERVDKLVLVSAGAASSKRLNAILKDFYFRLKNCESLEDWIREWPRWLFSPKCRRNKKFIEGFVKFGANYRYAQGADGFKGQADAVKTFDARGRLKKIKAKTLVLEGGKDALIPPTEAKALAKNIPGCVYQTIKGAAHCIHIEYPGQFIKSVKAFLTSK